MEWFSATFPGAPPSETIDGVQIVRKGQQWSVHWSAFRKYRKSLADRFDVVVDEINTIPFFTPIWSSIPVVMFIHQLAREVWWYESIFPLSALGFLAEPHYLRVYKHVPVLTVSDSTRNDLVRLGLQGPITVIPEGIETVPDLDFPKAADPTFIFVGRLAPSKRVGHLIQALAIFRRSTQGGRLLLLGSGSTRYRDSLSRLARRLGVDLHVEFLGRVSEAEKYRLMSSSTCLLMASVREGWGLVVSEANQCGTPAIVYDVPGLRDSVQNNSTGLVVPATPSSLANAMVMLTTDRDLYGRLVSEARRVGAALSFDRTASAVADVLGQTVAA